MTKYIQDGGHGGSDPGANGFGQVEKEWALEASQYVNKRLNELGIKSTQTRTSDKALNSTQRTNIVKASGATVCLSHHLNAFNGSAHGAETIHSIYSDGKLAQAIADEIGKTGQNIRRVFTRKLGNGDYYYMHRLTGNVETVIIEYFFIDNKGEFDEYKTRAKREVLYEAVVKAVCAHEKVKYVPVQVAKPAPKPVVKPVSKPATVLNRVSVNGKSVGAFGEEDNVIGAVKKALKANAKNILIEEVRV